VEQAISNLYTRSREFQDAIDRKEKTVQINLALIAARGVERAAVHAYDDHIKNAAANFSA
jgi:hypothetical protein